MAAGIAERQVALSTARVLTSQRLDESPLALVVSNAVACLWKSARHRNQEDGDQRSTDENREAEEFGRLEAGFQVELRRLLLRARGRAAGPSCTKRRFAGSAAPPTSPPRAVCTTSRSRF